MQIRDLISQELENELQGYCKLKTKGQLKKCNQCYKYWHKRCED